jgi:hypothetical protein
MHLIASSNLVLFCFVFFYYPESASYIGTNSAESSAIFLVLNNFLAKKES